MASPKKSAPVQSKAAKDDFKSVAEALGCDDDKARFEAKLGKLAKVGTSAKQRPK
jgi:hypothetical protein